MMYAKTEHGKRYHIVESQVQVRDPLINRTHAYCGDNAPKGYIVERVYYSRTWCGLSVSYIDDLYSEMYVASEVSDADLPDEPRLCARCASIGEKNIMHPEIS